jgi:DNA-directed RNA polymerase specialized sigma24 family protein
MPESQSSNGRNPEETPSTSAGSVTLAFRRLRLGRDERAAHLLCERYLERLARVAYPIVQFARRATVEDEEDAAIVALEDFFRRLADGAVPDLHDRAHIWRWLAKITERKAFQQLRRPRFEPLPDGAEGVVSVKASPEYVAHVKQTIDTLMDEVDDPLERQALRLYIEGYTVREIAASVDRTRECVYLWFRKIRLKWEDRHGESPIPGGLHE